MNPARRSQDWLLIVDPGVQVFLQGTFNTDIGHANVDLLECLPDPELCFTSSFESVGQPAPLEGYQCAP
jgi:hypothetical protein